MTLPRSMAVGLITVVAAFGSAASTAGAATAPFQSFTGTWSGSGHMRLEGGRTEGLRCRASYSGHNGGSSLGIALRCASASNRIDLHARLTALGSRVSGDWEEREFNAGGRAYGTASGNHIALSIAGGGLEGSMSVTTSGSRQSVSITTRNVALKGIAIGLSRD